MSKIKFSLGAMFIFLNGGLFYDGFISFVTGGVFQFGIIVNVIAMIFFGSVMWGVVRDEYVGQCLGFVVMEIEKRKSDEVLCEFTSENDVSSKRQGK